MIVVVGTFRPIMMSASMAATGCKAEVASIAENGGYDPTRTSGGPFCRAAQPGLKRLLHPIVAKVLVRRGSYEGARSS
jgi:hypothetical protein